MSTPRQKRWQRTSPLAAIFYLGRIYKAIAQNAVQSFAPIAAVLIATKGDLSGRIVLIVALFLTVTVIGAILRYWFFRYRIEEDSILIRDGVLKKTQLDIKFDRIQAVNTEQNFIFRQFGLVTLQLDTAGSAKSEGHLPAIRVSIADNLKDHIKSKRTTCEFETNEDDVASSESRSKSLLQLGNMDMIRIGLSSNRALIFLVLLGPVMENLGDRIEQSIDENSIVQALNDSAPSIAVSVSIVFALLSLFFIVLAAASIIGAFLRYHRFALVSEQEVLRSVGGLLTRHEHSVRFAKVQSLQARQNPILRWFRRFRVSAKQASSGRQGRGKQFIVPICSPAELNEVRNEVFGDEFADVDMLPQAATFTSISKGYIRSRFILLGLLPSVVTTFGYSFMLGNAAFFFLAWIPASFLAIRIKYRKYGYAIGNNGIVLRNGFLGHQTTAFLFRKVQRISVTQTLSQERKGLATLRFFLASGSLKLPYVDFRMARELCDYVLFKVESSQRAWH